jgi:hypothetical protein
MAAAIRVPTLSAITLCVAIALNAISVTCLLLQKDFLQYTAMGTFTTFTATDATSKD